MKYEDIIRLENVNGVKADSITCIGPVIAPNNSRYWLIRVVLNGKTCMTGNNEFHVVPEPTTPEWGWDLRDLSQSICYSFAMGVWSLITSGGQK